MVRFVLSGVIATLGNVCAVFVARYFVSLQIALLIGIACGILLSFVLTKFFAFRSYSWVRGRREAVRFSLVYAFGAILYWKISFAAGHTVLPQYMTRRLAEVVGVLLGAAAMMVTSYLGHRFFTYRRNRIHA